MSIKKLSYWHRNLLIISILLVIWLVVTFVPVYFAIGLSRLFLFGWPFSFWMAAIGAPASFLALIGWYAWYMDRLDQRQRQEHAQQKRDASC